VKFVDPVVELVGLVALQVDVSAGFPAQVGIRVLVGEAQRAAAARKERRRQDEKDFQSRYQKLSTVMCPGLRRRCLRSPRSASAAWASFSISGFPQSITCAS
jgi:hypothetical protein